MNYDTKIKLILTNQLDYNPLKKLVFYRENKYNNKLIFDSFFELDEFDLLSTYNRVQEYNGIKYDYEHLTSKGINVYDKENNRNYINIKFKNKIENYSTLVHELGHAKQFWLNPKFYVSLFSEAYSYFLSHQYLEHLKKFGLYKNSYNLKARHLDIFSIISDNICDEKILNSLKLDNTQNDYLDILKSFFSYILNCYFCHLYLKDKDECLNKIQICNENMGLFDDEELINKIGLKIEDLENLKCISLYINDLCYERKEAKQKLKK